MRNLMHLLKVCFIQMSASDDIGLYGTGILFAQYLIKGNHTARGQQTFKHHPIPHVTHLGVTQIG